MEDRTAMLAFRNQDDKFAETETLLDVFSGLMATLGAMVDLSQLATSAKASEGDQLAC